MKFHTKKWRGVVFLADISQGLRPGIKRDSQVQTGTARDKTGTKKGQPGIKQGQLGRKQGQPGMKQGQSHDW